METAHGTPAWRGNGKETLPIRESNGIAISGRYLVQRIEIPSNPKHDKDITMNDSLSKSGNRVRVRCPAPCGLFPRAMRVRGNVLSLASDIGDLEECLALERAAAIDNPSEGIHSPSAVPYCEFLMLRDATGRLQAAVRLMRLDGNTPVRNPLESGRFHLSPLLTALRYSREGILEMGAPAVASGWDSAKAAHLLWTGMIAYLEKNALGFVVGRETLSARAGAEPAWPGLMAEHGLHPDLEVEARPAFKSRGLNPEVSRSPGTGPVTLRHWPAGLQEALLRGCRLAGEPAFDPEAGCLEFVWVASLDMLESRESGDWRSQA